jgi:hypothetical protein
MSDVRRIMDAGDLERIHAGGRGYVMYPFGRKIHHARCHTVPGMMLNPKEPRWFAPDEESAVAYQRQRMQAYPMAKPFERVSCCASLLPASVLSVGAGAVHAPALTKNASASSSNEDSARSRDWECLVEAQSFSLWTRRRTPFNTDQDAAQKSMIREITPRLVALRCDDGSRLQGVFTSDDQALPQPDAENITFYNFGEAPFAGCGDMLSFERSYRAAPTLHTKPANGHRYHHRWSIVPKGAPFEHWIEGAEVSAWRDVPVVLSGDLALNLWRAIREHPDRVQVMTTLAASDDFGVEVTLTVPGGVRRSVVRDTKPLVDGPLAGLQRADGLAPEIAAKLLGRSWGHPMDEGTLHRLVAADRPKAVFPRAPFNRNGLDPCDERCVAGLVRIVAGGSTASMTGRVFRVRAK